MSALRPGQALTVKENMLVIESAQLMAAKRCDCVLVINEDDHLSGIFTVSRASWSMGLAVADTLDGGRQRILHTDLLRKI